MTRNHTPALLRRNAFGGRGTHSCPDRMAAASRCRCVTRLSVELPARFYVSYAENRRHARTVTRTYFDRYPPRGTRTVLAWERAEGGLR